ncbi:unnamed protein product [Cuscuta campestris]|uniref:Uncharacterized protein n=1 Tax=Cuscuta campestris TaxID=132261 RepID=A0A484L235_9ASTE|nr:unnamed protein product [Cuscuta campestris]
MSPLHHLVLHQSRSAGSRWILPELHHLCRIGTKPSYLCWDLIDCASSMLDLNNPKFISTRSPLNLNNIGFTSFRFTTMTQ